MGDMYRNVLNEAPFLRLLLPFASGIFLCETLSFSSVQWLILFFSALSLLTVYTGTGIVSRFRTKTVSGVLLYLLLFFLGGFLSSAQDVRRQTSWFASGLDTTSRVVICVEEPPAKKDRSFRANATVRGIFTNGKLVHARGRFILYFSRRDSIAGIRYGSLLLVPPHFTSVENSGNPGAFDYAAWCGRQHIYHQLFLRKNQYRVLTSTDTRWIEELLFASQQKVVFTLEKFVGGSEAALAEALLIGYKNNLDRSLLQEYAESGIIHVVAISGMHLGLIYWLLSLLLAAAEARGTRWLRALLILAGLWTFTFIAGASASVVRSAVMFTMLLVAELINRKSGSLNALAASAFLLLAFNTNWLWDLGFQLSYAALAGIMFFMKPVYNLLFVKNKLLDPAWKMCATCIAAQILTFPVVLLLTSRFPVYFLLTNLVAIPLSSLIVLGEVALCALSFFVPLADALARILHWLISAMNSFVQSMNRLPFANVNELYQEVPTVICLYLIIACFALSIRLRRTGLLLATLALLTIYFSLQLYYHIRAGKQQMLIVYNLPAAGMTEIVNGRSADMVTTALNGEAGEHAEQVILAAHNRLRVNRHTPVFSKEGKAIFRGRKIFCIRQAGDTAAGWRGSDYLIVSNIPASLLRKIMEDRGNAFVIFDSSVPRYKASAWMQSLSSKNCYAVSLNGAFIVNLN